MFPEDHKSQYDTDLLLDEPELKEPPLYQVILLNDDYTPMDFVIFALQKVFGMNYERATEIMLSVHTKGIGVCGICLLYTSPSPRDRQKSRMPSSA